MRNVFKKAIAFTVAIVILMSSFSVLSYAETEKSNDINSIVESGFESGKGLNSIANNLKVANDSENFSITYLEIKNNKAYVKINNSDKCKLVVAIYDENTLQMLTSNVSTADANISTLEVTLESGKIPDKFLAKAFLLDEHNAALCNEYVDNKNTTAYEEFLAKTPDDFSDENIVYFSENEENVDFGVLNNNIEIQKTSAKMTFSYNKDLKEYTFSNATSEVKKLSAGEIFYYPYSKNTNEFLLFKVAKVTVSGDTVTVTEDENIDLKDAFSFIRVDEGGDYSNVKIDQLGEAFTTSADTRIPTQAFDENSTKTFSETFDVEWPRKNDEAYKSAHVEGQLSFTLSTTVVLTYDPELFGEDYYEFKSETTFEFGLSNFEIVGKISLPDSVSKISTAPIPVGPFTLTPSIKFIFSVSASLGLSAVYKETITVSGDSANGVKKHTDAEKQIDADSKAEVEIKIGAGAELKLSLVEIVALSVSGEFGIVFKGNLEVTGKTDTVIHPCYICIYGKVNAYAKFDVSLSVVLLKDVIDYKVNFVNLSTQKSLGDMHISVSENGLDCGSGKCGRIMTKATFKVVGLDHDTFKNYPIEGATLTVPKGAFDADGDGEYSETYYETDADGMAYVFLHAGEYTATVKAAGYTEKTADIKMMYTPILETVVLSAGEGGKCGDNLIWTFDKASGILTISGTGDMYDYEQYFEEYDRPYEVPWNKSNINQIIIEDGVTSIGDVAFSFCGITSIAIPDSVKSIGSCAFWGCDSLTNITIPDSVINIGEGAFRECDSLTSITIPDSVTSIGYGAFYSCGDLTSITVSASNRSYSNDKYGVLFNKNKTELICYPIGNMRTSYSIPDSVTSIDDSAFNGCVNLTSITIPDSVTSIGGYTFSRCYSLTSVTIPDSITSIGGGAFNNCDSLTSITIPDSVTSIGDSAFYDCDSLTSITIPDSVTSIGDSAFYDCESLTNITIPDSIISISDYAFCDCESLINITIPDSVTSIGNSAFRGCDSLTGITVSASNKAYSSDKYGVLFNKNKTELIQYPIGNTRTSYSIPDSVTSIGSYAFKDCVSLTSVIIGNGVTSISEGAFDDCDSLTSITIPDSVTSIGSYAFFSYNRPRIGNVYYTGTQEQWNKIAISEYGNDDLLNATIHFNYASTVSTASTVSAMHYRINKTVYNAVASDLTFDGCVSGNKYMLIHVYSYYNGFDLTTKNLYFIDCVTADSNGTVNISFTPKEEKDFCTTILVGDFGNGTKAEILDSPINIKKPSVTSISYGDSIILHADLYKNLPSGWYIEWTASNGNFDMDVSTDGTTCKISPSSSGDTTFTATVYDAEGNAVSADEQTMTSKAGFFQKIIAFFKKLFGLTKTISSVFKF